MFKHILLPTDGSPASEIAVLAGIKLARENGASVTGLHVLPEFHVFTPRAEMLEETREGYEHDSLIKAGKVLGFVAENAKEQHVECKTVLLRAQHPYQKIVATALAGGCDLIAMATHGHLGIRGILLGSQTQKVLLHSPVPVLVFRTD
jgi:nucleotide-binding universal stress UspA family protein